MWNDQCVLSGPNVKFTLLMEGIGAVALHKFSIVYSAIEVSQVLREEKYQLNLTYILKIGLRLWTNFVSRVVRMSKIELEYP